MARPVEIISTENKSDEIFNWVEVQGLRGYYRIYVHYTYDFVTWYDAYVGLVNIEYDQQIGIRQPKKCFTRSFMFWNFKFVKQ